MSLEPDEDSAWMLRLQQGEDTALNFLMERWQKPLVAFIYRHIGDEGEALDLAQETFVRVFESRKRYKPTAKFSTWLFTIAHNLCRNVHRWQSRHPTVPLIPDDKEEHTAGLLGKLADQGESPFDTADVSERAAAVRLQIHALPADLKTVVLLFEYEDMSYQEIANVLGCSPKAVETRLYRARNLLRERLGEWKVR